MPSRHAPRVLASALLLLGVVLFATRSAGAAELKMATLAPKGSAWAKILDKGAKEIAARTGGRVTIKYYFSGQQGDERDVVRKMKLGQLDGAAVTAVGLGLIKGDVRVLELPYLFKNDRELDHVRSKMAAEFEKQFADAGYVLLAWGDVGWVHLYTNQPLTSRADLAKVKMWAWTDDAIVRTLFKRLGVNGVPLGVPDVLPSLNVGLINGCYGPPLAAVTLQWYTKVKYATAVPTSYSVGALLVRKEVFAKLSPEDQKAVREVSATTGQELMKAVRKDNEKARRAMEKNGIQFVAMPPAVAAELEKEGKAIWDELAGKLYSKDLLEKVKRHVAEVRK